MTQSNKEVLKFYKYIVKKGDSFSKIASKFYGHGSLARVLFEYQITSDDFKKSNPDIDLKKVTLNNLPINIKIILPNRLKDIVKTTKGKDECIEEIFEFNLLFIRIQEETLERDIPHHWRIASRKFISVWSEHPKFGLQHEGIMITDDWGVPWRLQVPSYLQENSKKADQPEFTLLGNFFSQLHSTEVAQKMAKEGGKEGLKALGNARNSLRKNLLQN